MNNPLTEQYDLIQKQYLESLPQLINDTIGKDCYIIGGSIDADYCTPRSYGERPRNEKFYIQLNHHILRRQQQPCDWLIARGTSGMQPTTFKCLNGVLQREVKYISCAVNGTSYSGWCKEDKLIFPFAEQCYLKTNPFHPCLEWCNQLYHEIDNTPLIGMMALKMAMMMPFSKITLIGFDFYADKDGNTTNIVNNHYIEKQLDWFKRMYNSDFRIEVDDRLAEVIKIPDDKRGITPTYEVKNN